MDRKSNIDLKSIVWLTSSTLFLSGLIFGLIETGIIIVFYRYLPFTSSFEKALFFLFCALIYPAVAGLLGIPLGVISYFLSQRFKKINRIPLEHFLIACYIFIGFSTLVGIRLERIFASYGDSIPMLQYAVGFLAVFVGAVIAFIIGLFISKLLNDFTSKVPVSICFVVSILVLGIVYYSFVKANGDVAKAKETFKTLNKISSEKSLEANPPPLDLKETNIILITIDTLRADYMSLYGYGRNTSPNIDNFARKGIVFTGAKTQQTSTAPSLASLLTGTYPNRHLVNKNAVVLQDFNITLPEMLKKYGYKTAAFQSNLVAGVRFGFNQGFDYFGEWSDVAKDELFESRELNKKVIPWLKENSEERFFLWIHYRDPHTPYIVPPEYEKLYLGDEMYGKYRNKKIKIGNSPFGEIRYESALNGSTDIDYYISQYDAEIKFNDDSIGELFRVFEELKLFQNSLIILTADHGESMVEHNYYFAHGDNTYEPTAWVPLIVYHSSLPGGQVVSNIVELVDIYPTIMGLLELHIGPQVQGKNLVPLIYNKPSDSELEYARTVGSWSFGYQTHAIQDKRWKLIYDVNEYWVYFDKIVEDRIRLWRQEKNINPYRCRVFKTEFYDLENDPGETKNLSLSGLPVEERLRTRLFEWIDSGNYNMVPTKKRKKEKLDKDTLEQLKALGYVN